MTGSRQELASRLIDVGIIAVVRLAEPQQALPVAEALIAGGVVAIEITMTVPDALSVITQLSRAIGARGLLGAGTVLDIASCKNAIEAGAAFVVSPIMRPPIAAAAHALDCPVMLGSYTPTEAQMAHEAGADFIKVFPADRLGPSYIKALRAPLPHLRIIPTGGVDLQTAPAFIQAGCVALGVGSALLSPALIANRKWDELSRLASQFVAALRNARRDTSTNNG